MLQELTVIRTSLLAPYTKQDMHEIKFPAVANPLLLIIYDNRMWWNKARLIGGSDK